MISEVTRRSARANRLDWQPAGGYIGRKAGLSGLSKVALLLLLVIGAGAVSAQTITLSTVWTGNTTGGNGGNMFDLATNTAPISISRFDVKMSSTAAQTVNVYWKAGTYVGFQTNPGAWTLHESVATTGAGSATPTPVALTTPLVIPAGTTYGIAVVAQTTALLYTSATTSQVYSDANLTLTAGAQVTTTFGSSIANRIWNGVVHYEIADFPTLGPATGSGFNSARVYDAYLGVALSNATLVANDSNDPNINVTVTPNSAAPGVTAPSSQAGAAVPHNMTWTGTPTAVGTYTYDVLLSDGTNNPTYTVTINVTDPAPTLDVPSGSAFSASHIYNGTIGVALANATLEADDLNSPNINITVTPVNPCPGVTAPSSQVGAAVPATLSWTGTPSAGGTYTYDISLFDGTNTTNQTVTFSIDAPGVQLGTVGTGNTFPFNYSATNGRFQTAYGASELNLAANTVIYEIRVAGNTVAAPEYGNLRLRMGYTNLAVNALTTTFDNNYTGTLTDVLGPVNITPSAVPEPATTFQWYIFPLSTPFVYNGTDSLLIDWSYDTRSGTGFNISTAVPTGEQARSRVYVNGGNYLSATGTAATTGGNYGIQMKVLTPNSVAFLGAGTDGGLSAPQTDLVVMDMAAAATTTARDLNSVTFTQTGTIADAAISAIKLVRDNNGDGLVDAGDTVLGTGTLTAGQVTFAGSPLVSVPDITGSGPVPLLLAVTIPGSLTTGTTASFEISAPSDVSWSGGTDLTLYPFSSGVFTQRMAGTYTINQTSGDFNDIGAAFDALETVGVSGHVILEITDSATYVATSSYSLGLDATLTALAPVSGASSSATITLRAAAGQTPVVQGNASGAGLIGYTARGGIGIMQSYVSIEGLEVTGGPNFGILIQGNGLSSIGLTPTDNAIRRCKVYDIPSGPGIGFFGQNSAYFTNGVIENNFVWNCHTTSIPATTVIQGSTATAGCIAVRNPASGSGSIRHNTILHTSGVANTSGMAFSAASTTYALNDVSNNIVVVTNPTRHALWLNSVTHASVPANWDFNYWFASLHCNQTTLATFATWQGGGRDTNGSNADPELVSTSGTIDLHLLPISPCVDPTGQTSALAVDIDGDTRPQGSSVDIGADEGNFPAQLWLLSSGAAPASATTGLAADQWLGSFRAISVNSAQQVNIATFTQVGSAGSAGFTNLKLWVDTNANSQWDATDTQIAGPVANMTGSTVTFTGLPAFTNNQAALVFITAQLAVSTTPGTAQFEITSSGDVSATPGPVTGSFPLQGAPVNVVNPAPTLTPATGSGFNASRVYNAMTGVALSAASLVADDSNDPTITVTITAISAAPGVTQPSNQSNVAPPATITWTGTPTTPGSYTYEVEVDDGFNNPIFTVTVNVTNPAPTLTPSAGSGFSAVRAYNATVGVALVNADLVADDVNNSNIDITVTPVTPAAGVTAPSSQTGAATPATLSWTGTPTTPGSFTYDVTLDDGNSNPTFTVTINVSNPAPTLTPATGSGFSALRVYNAVSGIALNAASLVADDSNDPTVSVTITAISAAPGVTQPANLTNANVPATITWTGTPTTVGSFTYEVEVDDGFNNPVFTVTINVTNPAPTLNPATGSGFTAARVYSGTQGTALSLADLVADDTNDPTVSFTITPVNPVPGVTAPANQTNVAAPATLSWTGTPTAGGVFTYDVQVSDGVNSPTFTVTFNIAFNGTVTVANGNPGGTFHFGSLGAVFDALETVGMGGPLIVEMYDDGGNFAVDDSYRLGVVGSTITIVAVNGLSAANTLTIKAASGETPVISGNCLSTYSTSTTEIGTMAFRNVGNITLEGLTFTGGTYYGVMWYASITGSADNLVIRGCKFHGISFGSAIYMYGSSTTTGPNNVLVENNFCWDVNGDGSGIGGGTTGGPRGVIGARRPGTNFVARHNTILLNSAGATASAFYTNGTNVPLADVSANVVYIQTAGSATFYNKDTSAVPPTTANRNVVFLGGSAAMVNDATLSTWAQWQASGRDANGLNTDPLLVNIGAGTEDLHLQLTSPAINLAVGSAATVDIDGDTRPIGTAADSGADEALVPEIEVLEGTNNVADGSTYNVGNVPTTTGLVVTFTVNNTGAADLLLNGATTVVATIINNLDAGSGVQSQPAITTIAAAGSTTFQVFLDPTIPGAFSLSISIDNNDLDENPFNFNVDGTAFTPNGEAEANTATGSSLSGGTNGPFTIALDPGTALANVEMELTDPEGDNINVTAITLLTAAPTGITAPAVPGAPGQPISLAWTGTADASNAPGAYTWEVEFADVGNQTVVTAQVTITINNLPPNHAISGATGGDGSAGNPYTAAYTATMGATADIDLASVSDPNTSQALFLGSITLGGANPAGGNGFIFSLAGGFLNVAPTAALLAADVGTHTFDVEVTDNIAVVTISVSIVVNAAPAFVSVSPLTDGEQGLAYSFQLVTSGGTGALNFTHTGGTLPPGVGLNASGLLSGTATQAGVYNFDITATDTLGVSVSGAFQITVDPPATGNPTITSTSPLPSGTQDAVYAGFTFTATGGTGSYSFSVSGGNLPPGLSLSAAGVVSGTPTLAGSYAFDVTVTDTAFATDTDAFQMVINPPPVVGGSGGGGGGGGGGCVTAESGTGPWLLLALIGAMMMLLKLRKARE